MKKKIEKYLLLVILSFFAVTMFASAETCNGVFTVEAAEFIKEGFDIIRIAVPILLLVFGTIDMAGAVFSGDAEASKKSASKFGKRAIAAVLVFFVPMLVNLLLGIPAVKNALNLVDDPTCGVVSSSSTP